MAAKLNLCKTLHKTTIQLNSIRLLHYKFKRVYTPPLQEPKESPYIVGPYLKPDYLPRQYITEPIRQRFDDDLDHFIYEPTKVEVDENRTVRLLLIEDVEGLGVQGQVVDTPYRFAASNLIALKKAEYATDFALKWYKFGPRSIQSASSALSTRTVRLLKNQIFRLPVSKSAIIEPWHLSLALRLSGCHCPSSVIEKDSITKDVDEENNAIIKCNIRINNHERVEVRFRYSGVTEEPVDVNL